jgi:hypothetical protein
VRHVFAAREESQQRASFACHVVTNGTTKHRISCFDCVKDRPSRDWTINLDFHIALDACKRSQMRG